MGMTDQERKTLEALRELRLLEEELKHLESRKSAVEEKIELFNQILRTLI